MPQTKNQPLKNSFNVVGIGELLWDIFDDQKCLGGAPGNVVYHCSQLGCQSHLISQVGQDQLGETMLDELNRLSVDDSLITKVKFDTGRADVYLDNKGIAQYRFPQKSAWDCIDTNQERINAAKQTDAICFGSLAQRSASSRKSIQTIVAATHPAAYRVFDVNLRSDEWDYSGLYDSIALANVVKLSDDELQQLIPLFNLPNDELAAIKSLCTDFNLKLVALTKGENGSILYSPDGLSQRQADKTNILDTVGAGDAFTAAIITGLLKGYPLEKLHTYACQLASFVCTKRGATPVIPKHFVEEQQ